MHVRGEYTIWRNDKKFFRTDLNTSITNFFPFVLFQKTNNRSDILRQIQPLLESLKRATIATFIFPHNLTTCSLNLNWKWKKILRAYRSSLSTTRTKQHVKVHKGKVEYTILLYVGASHKRSGRLALAPEQLDLYHKKRICCDFCCYQVFFFLV